MRVAPSAYYAARARPLSARSARDEALTDVIRRVWEENYCVFGVRKMHAFLNTHELGVGHVARCTVERLMRRMGIRGVSRRRTRHVTASAPRHACPLDLVNRHFGAHDLNELWVADITYVPTQAGWVYVAFVTDVCSRKILGWKVASSLRTDLALDALNMAICQRRRDDIDTRGLVHHSDRGVQYRDVRYGQALAQCKAIASVGSTGDSYDNALAEALNSLYKADSSTTRRAPATPAHGAIGARLNAQPPPGSTGTTPAAPTSPWAASHHNKQKTNTQRHERKRPQQASTKPGT